MKHFLALFLILIPSLCFATQSQISAGFNIDGSTITVSSGNVLSAGGGGTIISNITGNLPTAISGTSTTAAVTISSGAASDSTTAIELIGSGYSWAVSNGDAANGYQGGTTLPNSSTIHFFLCNGGSGTTSFASTSLTPSCPSGYATLPEHFLA